MMKETMKVLDGAVLAGTAVIPETCSYLCLRQFKFFLCFGRIRDYEQLKVEIKREPKIVGRSFWKVILAGVLLSLIRLLVR